ncbi:hypothetical protein [Pontibacillus sp. HMF3514]|uniref:hypothetical protein n=1 Tax=Pontibacillus sp. HMF3514 TaxID=2692425 RepID=UPI00132027B7|nr:hypothetical protein [Pontibacillus sp. HMF3514]QHE52835.1 hypothetical protein GS400_12740 [Pontibacillus sp. HMF3514]
MNKKSLLLYGLIVVLIIIGWYAYQKNTDDTYTGMSIIPEQHKDIPLFKGLKPRQHDYVISGKVHKQIYDYYVEELEKHGWTPRYKQLEENYFVTKWQKENFKGELQVSAQYNKFEEETEVIFDKIPLYKSTPWIEDLPKSICIYENLNQEGCLEIGEKSKVEEVKTLINKAIDWEKDEIPYREKTSVIDFGDTKIKVHYGNNKEIYLESNKGIKIMKPEREFFELTNLSK